MDAFVAAFQAMGYGEAANADYEEGQQKVCIYVRDERVTHMARQLESGRWTSKIGGSVDIEHATPGDLGGNAGIEYGTVMAILKRPRPIPA